MRSHLVSLVFVVQFLMLGSGVKAEELTESSTASTAVSETESSQVPAKAVPPTPTKKPKLPTETCSTNKGSILCQALDDVAAAYNWECQGSSCYGIWRKQIQQSSDFNAIYTQVLLHLPPNTLFNKAIGTKAYNLAYSICHGRAIGDAGVMASLVVSENQLLARLAAIQKRARISSVMTCYKELEY